ncbi:MobP3 family relaxase [Paenibacillus validus]|uniref:MobP3 family relaxase n=1 Tax=Paenibacillus validus TaxID=44253 RepID=UPI003D2A8329
MAERRESLAGEHGRFQAPFIFKMTFYSPSAKNQSKNAAHIGYIGTRPGADMGTEIGQDEKPVEAIRDELAGADPGTAAGHVKYAHERPGSHGLFSSSGVNPDLKEIQQELQEHQGVVWRSILSLTEEDAKRLDFDSRTKWEDALRAAVPEAAAKMGIGESNLRWVAAFHQEQGHPHVHLVMWEKDPQRTKGLLSKGERIDVKKAFMKQVYAEEQTRLYQEKTAMRDLIRDVAKGDTEKAVSILDDVRKQMKTVDLELQAAGGGKPGIAPKAYPDDIKAIAVQLDELSKLMPGKGRAALKFLPEEAKEKAREIADNMMQQPAFKESLDRYMKSVEEMTRLHTKNPEAIQKAKDKAYSDLRDRVANVVVKGAAQVNREDFKKELMDKKAARDAAQQQANVAKGVWKSVWKAMEQSRMQGEAQGEMQKRQEAQRQQRIRQQQQAQQEYERD